MKNILIIDRKGGVGKTLVANDPVEMDNEDILIIDMPATETTIDFVECSSPDTPIVYLVNSTNRFKATKEFMEFFKEEHKDEAIYCLPQRGTFVQLRLADQSVVAYNPRLLVTLATNVLTHGVWKFLKLKF